MSTTTPTLAVSTRTKTGSTAVAALKKTGHVPGVLFGHGSPPVPISLDARSLDELLKAGGTNHLLAVTVDGGAPDTALIRDVQRDPITRRVIHADFQRVGATEQITAALPLVAVGVADGVKNMGGVMDVLLHTVTVVGPARDLPEAIEADVRDLGVGAHLYASDLKLPAGITLGIDPHTILISIEASRTGTEATPAGAAPEATTAPTS